MATDIGGLKKYIKPNNPKQKRSKKTESKTRTNPSNKKWKKRVCLDACVWVFDLL